MTGRKSRGRGPVGVGITICLPCWLPERLCGSVLPLIPVLPCSFAWNYPTTPQVFFLKNTDSQHADFLAFCPSDPLSHSFQAFSRQITSILPPKDQNSASVFFFLVQVLCQIWECLWQALFSFQRSGGAVKDIQFLDSQNPLPTSVLQCEWHYLGDPETSTRLSIWLRTAIGNGLQSCSNVI